jgi:hypothetical protein
MWYVGYVACRNLDLQGAWLSQFHHTKNHAVPKKNKSMARKSRNSKLVRMASMAQRKRLDWFFAVAILRLKGIELLRTC